MFNFYEKHFLIITFFLNQYYTFCLPNLIIHIIYFMLNIFVYHVRITGTNKIFLQFKQKPYKRVKKPLDDKH